MLEALAPIHPGALREGKGGYDPSPPADLGDVERNAVLDLLGPTPVPVDELIRQSGLPSSAVQTVLLELELAGRLERHAGGKASRA